jgi:hypothetical protein
MMIPFRLNSTWLILMPLIACLFTLPKRAQAQITGHYVAGVEGIKAATLPPPGFYLRDYNIVYFSDRLNDKNGDKVPVKFNLSVYANVIRPIWMTGLKLFGGDFGADFVLPLVYTNLRAGSSEHHTFRPGDIMVRPVILAWHPGQFDFVTAYGIWVPTGDFDRNNPAKPGKGFWSNTFTVGGTWHPDKERTFAVALLNWYEIHTRNHELDVTPGHAYTLEWGLSKALTGTLDIGVVGYYQQQTTSDHGRGITSVSGRALDRVFAMGPEVSLFFPNVTLFAVLRYNREFAVKDRPQGNTLTLTLTKRW